jgi:hypothetical protein
MEYSGTSPVSVNSCRRLKFDIGILRRPATNLFPCQPWKKILLSRFKFRREDEDGVENREQAPRIS